MVVLHDLLDKTSSVRDTIERSFSMAFASYPEIDRGSVVLEFGVPLTTRNAEVFDTHSKRHLFSNLASISIDILLLLSFGAVVSRHLFLSFILALPMLKIMLDLDYFAFVCWNHKKHPNKYIIRFREKPRSQVFLDFVMFHEFAHVLCCMGVIHTRWIFPKEEQICDHVARVRLLLNKRV